jgi:hypothetical protein
MRARSLSLASLLLLAPIAQSCATFVNGSTQPILFDSVPQGATVIVKKKAYTTPCLVNLPRTAYPVFAEVYKPGFAPQTLKLTSHENGWMWGNLLLLSITGVIVDAITGANNTFDEENHRVYLLPVSKEFTAELTRKKAESDSPFGRPKP